MLEHPFYRYIYTRFGIIGVGHEVKGLRYAQGIDQQDHLVEQGSLVAVGEYDAFVDTTRQRYREYA